MNKEEKLLKIKKNSKTIKTLIQILLIIFIIGAVGCLVGICGIAMTKDLVNESIAQGVSNGSATFNVSSTGNGNMFVWNISNLQTLADEGKYNVVLQILCLIGLVNCIVLYFVFHFFRSIFISIEQSESPFTEDVLKKLKIVFIALTIFVLFSFGLLQAIIAGLIMRGFYYIIDYGCAIQTEVDETL